MATNGSFIQQEQYKVSAEQYPATAGPVDAAANAAGNSNLSKDEVGWYFVEQYYTTLSKSPEKLHVCYPVCPFTLICGSANALVPSSSTANAPSSFTVSRQRWQTFPLAVRYVFTQFPPLLSAIC